MDINRLHAFHGNHSSGRRVVIRSFRLQANLYFLADGIYHRFVHVRQFHGNRGTGILAYIPRNRGWFADARGDGCVTTVFPVEQRGMALGFWAIASAASVSFGPLIGGYLVDNLNWNYIFFVNIPIGIFSIIYTMIVQREYKLGTRQKFDIPGLSRLPYFCPYSYTGCPR